MQKEPGTPVEIAEDDVPDITEVDAKLVALARARSRVILTNDFNLNRVAEAAGRPGDQHQLAGRRGQAGRPARAEEIRVRVDPGGKEGRAGSRLPG